jgi:hypothetical protein
VKDLIRGIGSKRPRFLKAFGVGVIMGRTDLDIFFIRVVDLALNPALQRSVIARAGGQIKDHDGPKDDE